MPHKGKGKDYKAKKGHPKKQEQQMSNYQGSATQNSGLKVTWGAEHRTGNGRLISRQVSINPPDPPMCLSPKCIWRYIIDSLTYSVILSYHDRRTRYAESNRNKDILERYRTGEPSPQTLWQAIHANTKLTCPICRKYNVDPFLGRNE